MKTEREIKEMLQVALEGHKKEIEVSPSHIDNQYCEGYFAALRNVLEEEMC